MRTIITALAALALTTSPALAQVAEHGTMTSQDRAGELITAIENSGAVTDAECEEVEAELNATYIN